MTIEDYQRLKSRYMQLKSDVDTVADDLRDLVNNLSCIKDGLDDKYLVDNSNTPLMSRIKSLHEESNDERNYLVTTIMSAIDSEIRECDREIARLQAEQSEA